MTENTTICDFNAIPSVSEYLSATNVYGITLVCISSIAVITILIMFIDTLHYIMKNSSSRVKAHSAFVIGVYPTVALVTYFAILVPRAHLLAEALTQGVFMAAMYQLFCLFVAYCGGEAVLISKVKPGILSLKVSPCCCWPCCSFLPVIDVTKATIQRLRLLVLQLPIVQCLAYLLILVMWAERESLYRVNYFYLQPIIGISILSGAWGMAMTINVLKTFLGEDYRMVAKFAVLQLVLIFAKSQGLVTRILVWTHAFPCKPPITPTVYGNLLHNVLMLSEMLVLQYFARYLYKKPLPIEPKHIGISTIGGIMTAGILQNNNNENFNVKLIVEKAGHVNVALDVN